MSIKSEEWFPISEQREFMNRPVQQFIVVKGVKFHSDRFWNRVGVGIAWICREDNPNSVQGYRKEDIERILDDNDMEHYEYEVTHWLPVHIMLPKEYYV